MNPITRDELRKLTPQEQFERWAAGLLEIEAAQRQFALSCQRLAVALPRFVEACGPGRAWKMASH